MPLHWPHLSIRSAVLLAIAGAVLLPTAVLWRTDQSLTRELHEPLIAHNRQAVLDLTAGALSEPVWTIDERRIRSVAQAALAESSVLALQLIDRRPEAAPIELRRDDAPIEERSAIRLATEVLHEGQPLAELALWFDDTEIERVLARRRSEILKLAGLQMLLSMALLLPMFYWRLLLPIRRLKQQASRMAQRAPDLPALWPRQDELGELGRHLNEVHGQVNALFQQLEAQAAEMQTLALHDGLTGLPNRRLFGELTQRAVAAAQRDGQRLALLFIDIDRFKQVNDSLGHAAGDELLQTVARRLRSAVRSADVVCRHSGDEFTLLLRHVTSVAELTSSVQRLLKAVGKPLRLNDADLQLSVSVGIALFPDDGTNPDTLVRHADAAMYSAKQAGRGRCRYYRAELNVQLRDTLQTGQAMAEALDNAEFVLRLQPLLHAGDGRRNWGCEAMLYWQHAHRGLMGPAEFMPAAEQAGLGVTIGAKLLTGALGQWARWRSRQLAPGRLAVRLSALQMREPALIDALRQALAAHALPPSELMIVLDEEALLADVDASVRLAEQLHGDGVGIALGRFGAAGASLGLLQRLRPQMLQLDPSLLRSGDGQALAIPLVPLARSLDIAVAAGGLHSRALHAAALRCGCDPLQGDAVAPPMAAHDYERGMRPSLALPLTSDGPSPAG